MTNQWIKAQSFLISAIAMTACATESTKIGGDFVGAAASDSYNGPMLKAGKVVALAEGGLLAYGGASDHPRALSAAFATEGGMPVGASQAHEAIASSLWSGRTFKTIGRPEDDRIKSYRKFDIANQLPKGWSFKGNGVFHEKSGLQCDVSDNIEVREIDGDGNEKTSTQVFELDRIDLYNQNGLDVSCNYTSQGNAIITRYASYYPDRSLDDHVDATIAAIRQNFNIQSETDVILPTLSASDGSAINATLGDHHAGGFLVGKINGIEYKTALWLTVSNDWHVKVRATYPKENVGTEFLGAVTFIVANERIKHHTDKTGPPTSVSGAEV